MPKGTVNQWPIDTAEAVDDQTDVRGAVQGQVRDGVLETKLVEMMIYKTLVGCEFQGVDQPAGGGKMLNTQLKNSTLAQAG